MRFKIKKMIVLLKKNDTIHEFRFEECNLFMEKHDIQLEICHISNVRHLSFA